MRGSFDPAAGVDRVPRAVARAVVGDDDFLLDAAELDGAHALDHLADRLLLVVDGNDDGELHRYDACGMDRIAGLTGLWTARLGLRGVPISAGARTVLHLRLGAASLGLGRLRSLPSSSRWCSRAASRSRRWKCRGDMRTSRRSSTGCSATVPWIPLVGQVLLNAPCRAACTAFARHVDRPAHRRRWRRCSRACSRSTPIYASTQSSDAVCTVIVHGRLRRLRGDAQGQRLAWLCDRRCADAAWRRSSGRT